MLETSEVQAEPLEEAMNTIALLEQTVRQKEQALVRTTAASADVEVRLADAPG